ncbi:MAG: hypothetical protein DMD38_04210 [Gemmatimonadetes bacterium]|nr:MAG: hypothetical protein DMD38_04210 [Gemmatimonadota bacterium]
MVRRPPGKPRCQKTQREDEIHQRDRRQEHAEKRPEREHQTGTLAKHEECARDQHEPEHERDVNDPNGTCH